MAVRLLPWQPEYGTAMQFDADADEATGGPPDIAVERATWAPVTPAPRALPAVQIVDGVRRAEAHAMDDAPDGTPMFGLFGSFAVGAVQAGPFADAGRAGTPARLLDERFRVERRYFHSGDPAELLLSAAGYPGIPIAAGYPGIPIAAGYPGIPSAAGYPGIPSAAAPADLDVVAGRARLHFRAEAVRRATSANSLVARLNQVMLDEESKLAEELSRDESVLTLVDGPLRSLRSPGRRVVGYIKRIQQWYISRQEVELLQTLRAGERTPIFHIAAASTTGLPAASDGRYSWFVRLADLDVHFHPLGGVMRLETSATLPLGDAVRMADETALFMPRLASSPARDPRAPHNLTPVGALEARLTHLLGDRLLIRRLLTASIARPVREEAFG